MSGVNKVILIGNVGSDPQLKNFDSGSSLVNFPLATNETFTKEGNVEERTEWHQVIAWGKLAEIIDNYVTAGSKLYVEGKLQTRKWQDQDGQDHYTTEIVARDVQFLGSKKHEQAAKKSPLNQQADLHPDLR